MAKSRGLPRTATMAVDVLRGSAGDPSSASNIADFTTSHIDIEWDLDFAEKRVSGHVELSVERRDPSVNELIFDASALEVQSVSLVEGGRSKLLSYRYEPEGGKFGGKLV